MSLQKDLALLALVFNVEPQQVIKILWKFEILVIQLVEEDKIEFFTVSSQRKNKTLRIYYMHAWS